MKRRTLLTAPGTVLAAASHAGAQTVASGLIDCQSHLFSPEMLALMEKRTADPTIFTKDGTRFLKMGDWLRKVPPLYLDVDAKLATMDAAGIAMTALSINDPGPEWFGDEGAKVARMANDFVAGVIAKHPTRFFGLCVLPFQDMKATLAELDRCVKELGIKGVLLYTNLAGRFSDEPEFRPFFKRAVELDVPVLLHPAKPLTTEQVKGYEMTSTLGNMFDNTIALTRLLMSGILDELPALKLVCPHLGGTLPYIVGRLQHQVTVLKRGPQNLQHTPLDYLHRIWMDIVSPLPEAMKMCLDLVGPDRLLYASDHPWVQPEVISDDFRSLKLSAEIEEKVFSGNARKLFRL
ncbi:MAG: amidohydrolase family protein [Verrucomicrobiaceae bacterium]|nr:amidohydrolase family protein [Verrucomicrobiaceae bacterium]